MSEDTAHCGQEFFVQITFAGRGRHLDRDDRERVLPELLIEVSAVVSQELLDDACLAHASRAVR